jgi:hypothetical protein
VKHVGRRRGEGEKERGKEGKRGKWRVRNG